MLFAKYKGQIHIVTKGTLSLCGMRCSMFVSQKSPGDQICKNCLGALNDLLKEWGFIAMPGDKVVCYDCASETSVSLFCERCGKLIWM